MIRVAVLVICVSFVSCGTESRGPDKKDGLSPRASTAKDAPSGVDPDKAVRVIAQSNEASLESELEELNQRQRDNRRERRILRRQDIRLELKREHKPLRMPQTHHLEVQMRVDVFLRLVA